MPEVREFLSSFNFEVIIAPSGMGGDEGVSRTANFAEVSGLELSIEVETLREGGYNTGVRQLVRQASGGTIVLKRGMTEDRAFWSWVQRCLSGSYPLPYASGQVRVFEPAGKGLGTQATWTFVNGIAVKVTAATLNAAGGGGVPMEELHIAHEGLTRGAP